MHADTHDSTIPGFSETLAEPKQPVIVKERERAGRWGRKCF